MADDIALCGDPTCEDPGCRQSAIDAWNEAQALAAKELVYRLRWSVLNPAPGETSDG